MQMKLLDVWKKEYKMLRYFTLFCFESLHISRLTGRGWVICIRTGEEKCRINIYQIKNMIKLDSVVKPNKYCLVLSLVLFLQR